MSITAGDSNVASNISANTTAFNLKGGKYQVLVSATFGGGSVKLQALGPDGSTYISPSSTTADFTAAGGAVVDLAPGKYRWTIATASAVYASVVRIPG
jgi:hypothetical protein